MGTCTYGLASILWACVITQWSDPQDFRLIGGVDFAGTSSNPQSKSELLKIGSSIGMNFPNHLAQHAVSTERIDSPKMDPQLV